MRLRRIAAVLLACAVVLSFAACRDEEFDNATLEVLGDVEYTTSTVSPLDYVRCSSDEVEIAAQDELDAYEVGTHDVSFELTKDKHTRTEVVQINVRDTQPPSIRLETDRAEVSVGDEFDATSYVGSVKDPYDGDLGPVTKAPKAKGTKRGEEVFYDEGFYVAEGKVDTKKPGEYTVTYKAEDKHGNEASAELTVVVVDPLEGVVLTPTTSVLEYSKKTTDPTKLVTCSVEDATITADELSLNKVGNVSVTYTITKGVSSKTAVVAFEVRDTKFPQIILRSDEVTVAYGEVYDPYTNVESVTDEVDGDLARPGGQAADDNGGSYLITGDFNTGVSGKYFLTVQATDSNGNQTSKDFSVVVSDPPVPEVPTSETESQMDILAQSAIPVGAYVLNHNTMVFHYPGCRHANRISAKNREDVQMSRDEIIAQGFSPCGVCSP